MSIRESQSRCWSAECGLEDLWSGKSHLHKSPRDLFLCKVQQCVLFKRNGSRISFHCVPTSAVQITTIHIISIHFSFSTMVLQCFGWLGLNGAGKSTTFKMLTKQLAPTAGSFNFLQPGTRMGYCPQSNSLDPYLTVGQTIKIYAALLGVPSSDISRVRNQTCHYVKPIFVKFLGSSCHLVHKD